MKVSFIITTKNEEKYIKNTCLSILNQSLKIDKEIILVDALSKDRTVEIAKNFVDKIIIKKSNISEGKNIGASLASGDILVFVNADVVLEKNWLEKAMKHLEDASVGAVHGLIKPMERSLRARLFVLIWDLFIIISYFFRKVHTSGETTLAVRREVFFKAKGFREDLSAFEDVDIGLRISKLAKVKLVRECKTIASLRRFEREGYLKWLIVWLSIGMYYFLRGRSLLREYPEVR